MLLFLLFPIYFVLGLLVVWYSWSFGVEIEFNLMSVSLSELYFCLLFDGVSCVFVYMLLCCGSLVLFYCFHYFGGSIDSAHLFLLVVWFLDVMVSLILSFSPILTLIFWEYLGLVSFFLILFYSNSCSLRASLVTLFISRLGDVALFIMVMCFSQLFSFSGVVFSLLFLLIVVTKSACFPFVSWLLEAMRAPTPVSSLVHSSTLVAAGVWFIFRYNGLSEMGIDSGVLTFLCLASIFVTSFCALVFLDLKKIVALSTCNNISWCLLFFIFGDLFLSLMQLLVHGICKCYLFISVGDLMSSSNSDQSSLGVHLSRYKGNSFFSIIQVFLVLCLSGVPFLGVFFSKHAFFSLLAYSSGSGILFCFLFCLFFSFVYSVRFCLLLVHDVCGMSLGFGSSFLLICPLVFLGTFFNYLCVYYILEIFVFDVMSSIMFLIVQGLGCFFGIVSYFLFPVIFGRWSSLLWGMDSIVSKVYSFFLPFSSFCLVSFYRWEDWVFSKISRISSKNLSEEFDSLFTLNVLVLGLLFFLGVSLLLF
uniref:NADH:ubiquinone reductase (H(+)-translocating) n=1 Tax=Uvitellina sp. SSS-2019 TaxID=2587434 RepID=A0A4Y5RCX3_9TREM|nr:NADH dehydrogenase subunit 5 [Uvitellina sp. SSS-2019]QCY72822.1 NADH dehydrogenase subunit 5 [Uvitellina sp. SSS-2019]